MKIGILTFYFAHNYGAVLQAYAMKKYLLLCKYDVEIVGYCPQHLKKQYSINPIYKKRLINKLKCLMSIKRRIKQYYLFEYFIEHNLKPVKEKKYPFKNNYDVIIVGSDQVWNLDIIKNDKTYFIPDMSLKCKKISYAASFGDNSINLNNDIIRYLKDFDYISCREKNDNLYINNELKIDLVVDPVFLLPKQYWIKCARDSKYSNVEKKYIFYYCLKTDSELERIVSDLYDEYKYDVYIVHPIISKQKVKGIYLNDIGPEDFIALLYKSEFIVTNSFHATAFGSIFGKRIYSSKFDKGGRISSLLKIYGKQYIGKQCIDFKNISREKIDKYINKSKNNLNAAING